MVKGYNGSLILFVNSLGNKLIWNANFRKLAPTGMQINVYLFSQYMTHYDVFMAQ